MLGAIATLPAQLRDGYARSVKAQEQVARAWPQDAASVTPRTLVICGMGGSGVGADLLPAVFATRGPVFAVKGYELPEWVSDEDRVVCVSYSGNTAETIACFKAAIKRSVVAAVVTSGGTIGTLAAEQDLPIVDIPQGMQPRAAVGVLFGALAGIAEALNVVDDAEDVIGQAAAGAQVVIDLHVEGEGDSADAPALGLARQLEDCAVVIYGSGVTVPVAQRWKAQINENGKVPAFANAYPELDHNELVGWEYAGASGARWALVELVAANVLPEIRLRMDVTRELIDESLVAALRLDALSVSRAGSVFELLAWGDYVSVYLALLRGIDPSPVDRITALKERLGGA